MQIKEAIDSRVVPVLPPAAPPRPATDSRSTFTAAPPTTVSITNQLTTAIDIYDVFNPSTDAQQAPIQFTKLTTVAPGATAAQVPMIRPVAMVLAAVTGPVAELNGNYYTQFPVKVMSGTQVTFGTPPPLAYTVTPADRLAAIRSFQFHKFMSANPDSALTKSFNKSIKAGFAGVDAFFQGTVNYKSCTMASWHIVMTWLQNVPSGWQGPYYLYAAPSPVPANYIPQLTATLNIKSDSTGDTAVLTICGMDGSGNPVYATPTQQTALMMMGDGTIQEADQGNDDTISVSLTPVWMNVIQTPVDASGTAVPKYLIGSAMTGTINGTAVVSSQTARQLPGEPASGADKESTWDKLFTKGIEIVGGLAGLVAIYEFLTKKKDKSDPEKEDAKKTAKDEADLKAKTDAIDAQVQTEINDPVNGLPAVEAQATVNTQKVSDGYADTITEMKKDAMTSAIEEKLAKVENTLATDIAEGTPPSNDVETAFTDAQTKAAAAVKSVNDGDFTSWKSTLDQSVANLSTTAASADANASAELQTAVEDLQTSVQEAAKQTAATDAAAEAHDQAVKDESTDSGGAPDDVNEPADTDPVPPVEK